MINKNAIANYFYEQCAGSSSGHMALIPSNPVLFGLIEAISGGKSQEYAASKAEFAEILRAIADDLDPVQAVAEPDK